MTDISGYRDDARATGQIGKSAVAQQLGALVTDKLPLLNNPGAILENSLYYDINSSTVTAVELQETFQKDRIDFNNFNFGSSPTCYIPSVLFANTVYANMILPDVSYPAVTSDGGDPPVYTATPHYFHAPHGWGFAAINSVILYMGASSIAQIAMSGDSNLLIMMATCETENKRNLLLTKAGHYLNSQDPASILANWQAGGSVFRRRRTDTTGSLIHGSLVNAGAVGTPNLNTSSAELRTAMVPIRLPFSSMIAIDKRISMDTKLLTQPIQITLGLKQETELFDTSLQANGASPFRTMSSLTCQLWQEELSDKSMSIRQELLRQPEFNVGYPFQYVQSYDITVPSVDAQQGAFDGQQSTRMNLSALINSDLTTMLFYVRNQNASGGANIGTSNNVAGYNMNFKHGAWAFGEELDNMELKLNGQRFFAFDNNNYDQATLAKQMDAPSFKVHKPVLYVDQNQTNPQWIGSQVNGIYNEWAIGSPAVTSNYYELNFGKIRSITSEAHMQNTGRFTNQTFQISFTINKNKRESISIPAAQKVNYRFYMSYLYNAVLLIGGDGGTTKLITN